MKYYFGFIALVIVIFFSTKLILDSGHKTTKTKTTPTTTVAVKARLSDYANTRAEVSVMVIGPVVAHENRYSMRIIVARDERRIEIINGYNNLVIKSQTYDNNLEAYNTFLHALEYLNFTSEVKPKITDDTGVCATGYEYIYELRNTGNKDSDKRLWAVTCGAGIGNAANNGPTVRNLFVVQIPDYGLFLQNNKAQITF